MIPADLLQRLQEANHALWEEIYQAGFNHCNWPDYLVQGKLQDAVRARGWGYKMRYLTWAEVIMFDSLEEIGHGDGVTEAEALLQAYLEAIEAIGP